MLKTIEILKNILIEDRIRWTKELVQKESTIIIIRLE